MFKETGMTAPLPHPAISPRESNARPTMRDIARLAGGVHPSTVSLALRNHPGISEATRKKVCAAARKLGYRPDPLLDAFNTHRLEVLPHKAPPIIAFMADFESRSALEKSPQHAALWAGARSAAEMLHCQIELFLVGKNQLSPERLNSILRARGIVSLVIGACRPSTTHLAFDWNDYSAVKIESPHLDIPLYTLSSDQRQAARLAFRRLYDLGYRRLGLLTHHSSDSKQDDLYRAGFLLEQRRSRHAAAVPPLTLTSSSAPNVVESWIRANAVDAIVSDTLDLPPLLARMGLEVPREVGFAALDATGDSNQVSGIIPDHARVGAQAVEQVVGLMRINQRGLPATASCTYVPVSWREGATCALRSAAHFEEMMKEFPHSHERTRENLNSLTLTPTP